MTEHFKSANILKRKSYFQHLIFFKYEKKVDNIKKM